MMLIGYTIYNRLGMLVNECIIDIINTTIMSASLILLIQPYNHNTLISPIVANLFMKEFKT